MRTSAALTALSATTIAAIPNYFGAGALVELLAPSAQGVSVAGAMVAAPSTVDVAAEKWASAAAALEAATMTQHAAMAASEVAVVATHQVVAASMGMAESMAMAEMAMATGTAVAAAAAATHTVMVGGDAGLVYTPNQVMAAAGDVVQFVFMSKNHTLTQSTFPAPCVKMAEGLDSGFMANPDNTVEAAPTFELPVTDTAPTWWYCKQKGHCGKGMVFAVNPTAEKSFDTFQMMAMQQNGTAESAAAVTTIAAATTTAAAVAAPAATTTAIAAGWNQQGNTGACSCACLCGVAAFPAGAGVGAFGGFAGSLPAPW